MSSDSAEIDYYAVLGLDRRCTLAQIRAAYRLLAKRFHPDLNPDSPEALARSQEINAAHETLSDPARRRAYDRDRDAASRPAAPGRAAKVERNIAQDVHLRIEEFLRGTIIEVRVKDPVNPHEVEIHRLEIPPETAPGTRFKLARPAPFEGGSVNVRVKALPGFRFKIRGSDLRCDLRINAQRATRGGSEMVTSATGRPLRIEIPAGIARGEELRIAGEGLPKPRGGRGDLVVRVTYRPEVRVTRLGR
jgi:DnaJ-class molecular chaperone